MGRSLGRGLREFKHSVSDDKAEPERLELASDRTREHENAA
jgi:Sec-independent protein translocase protein TatA